MKKITSRGYNLIFQDDSGKIIKFTPHLDEAVLATHLLCWKKDLHPMLPLIDGVYKVSSDYYGIWREDLKDIDLKCCDLKNIWLTFIRQGDEKLYSSSCHFNMLKDLYLWLLKKSVIIGDLGLSNWGYRGKTLVVRDFGGIEKLPPLKDEIPSCKLELCFPDINS